MKQGKSLINIRVGKIGSLGPWSRVIVYAASWPFAEMIPQWENHFGKMILESLLQYTMTLL